jgi:hypothetical protein
MARGRPALRARLSRHLIDPSPLPWKRNGIDEPAFVVARGYHFVVVFDDVEEMFGTAKLIDGRVVNPVFYASLALTLGEFEQLEIAHGNLC